MEKIIILLKLAPIWRMGEIVFQKTQLPNGLQTGFIEQKSRVIISNGVWVVGVADWSRVR